MSELCFIDTETTGLDPRIHQPYEICYWLESDSEPRTFWLEHTLEHADQQALDVSGYWERGAAGALPGGPLHTASPRWVATALQGVTLVGSNPAFDAAMLTRYIGTPVWHHRSINVADGAMWLLGWDRPKGLAGIRSALVDRGFAIPEPDHTAEGDVRATRAVYDALRVLADADA